MKKFLRSLFGVIIAGGILAAVINFILPKIWPGNLPPKAIIVISGEKGKAPLKILADGSKSADPEGEKLKFEWSINGTPMFTERTFEKIIEHPGLYNLVLTVTDPKGLVGKDSSIIEVFEPKDLIFDQYARLAGAVEIPILIQIQTAGGIECVEYNNGENSCSIRKEHSKPLGENEKYENRSIRIPESLVKFWNSQWPFNKALPIGTTLWRTMARDTMIGFELLNKIDPNLDNCLRQLLNPWQGIEREPSCRTEITRKVGFLFWIFQNSSEERLLNLKIIIEKFDKLPLVNDYLKQVSSPDKFRPKTEFILPILQAGQQAIVLISVYERLNSGFEKKFLLAPIIPRVISYEQDGHRYEHIVRTPLREKAATVLLPFGWYSQ